MRAACVVALALAAPAAGFLAPFGGVVRHGSAPLLRSGNLAAQRSAISLRPASCARLGAVSGGRRSGLLVMQMTGRDELVQFEDLKSDFEVCKRTPAFPALPQRAGLCCALIGCVVVRRILHRVPLWAHQATPAAALAVP
jgi:hypothetical protein